ncbi:hypothetical protein ACXYFN_03070 [Mycoplasma sp. 48589B]
MNISIFDKLKKLTIAHILLTIIPSIIMIIGSLVMISSLTGGIVLMAIGGLGFVATLVIFIMLLITTAQATSYASSENYVLLWVSFGLMFLVPLASWIINFIVANREA